MKKLCFKCGKEKDIEKFYKHPATADRHLNKCKECTKKDVHSRYSDPEAIKRITEYERKRFLDPIRKAKMKIYLQNARKKYPGKAKSRRKISNSLKNGKIIKLPCVVCGDKKVEAHHKDYRKPMDIIWLCHKHHREIHGNTSHI